MRWGIQARQFRILLSAIAQGFFEVPARLQLLGTSILTRILRMKPDVPPHQVQPAHLRGGIPSARPRVRTPPSGHVWLHRAAVPRLVGTDLPRGFRTMEMTIFRPRSRAAGNCSGRRSGIGTRALNVDDAGCRSLRCT